MVLKHIATLLSSQLVLKCLHIYWVFQQEVHSVGNNQVQCYYRILVQVSPKVLHSYIEFRVHSADILF